MQENTDQENSEYGTFHAVGLSEKIRKSMDNESKQEDGCLSKENLFGQAKFLMNAYLHGECYVYCIFLRWSIN